MVSHRFFYQLVLIALVWLCVMLQWAWPSDRATAQPTPEPTPLVPKRHRERKPFAGLTTKPHCDACAHASALRPEAPCSPPPRTAVPTQTVPIGVGSAGAISAPMAIPVAVAGGSSCVSPATALFWRPSAPS